MKERRSCSGTMSGGSRACYFNATNKVGSHWYCNKCMRVRARAQINRRPKVTTPKLLSEKDLRTLYMSVMRSKARGTLDMHSARELVFNIMPTLLRELFRLRGLKEPRDD